MSIVGEIKRLGKDTISYGFSSALQKLITIFLFPIYARLLSPDDFGIQDVIQTSVYIVTLFLVLGLDSSVMMYYYEVKEDERIKIVSSYLWFQIIVSVPIAGLLIVFAESICSLILKEPSLAVYFQIGVLSIPFSLISSSTLNTLRLTFQTKKFVLLTTLGVLFQVISAILLVIVFRQGVLGVMLSVLISNLLQSILGLFFAFNSLRFYISTTWLVKLLRAGIPLIPAALSFWVLSYANRFFLVNYVSMEEVGLLSVITRISSILLLFLSAFSTAWGPYAYNLSTDKELARITFGKILTLFTLLSFSAALALSLYSRELILILASAVYEEGSSLVIVYLISSVLWVAMYIVGIGTGLAKKSHHYTISVIFGAITSIVLNYLLIPAYGVAGAAYATLAGNVIATVYMYFAGQHFFSVIYDFKKLAIIIVVLLSAAYIGIWVDRLTPVWEWRLISMKALIMLLAMALLLFSRIVSINQFKQAVAIFRKPSKVNITDSVSEKK
jgi:O-antigen/teichoic acid export membrane protein